VQGNITFQGEAFSLRADRAEMVGTEKDGAKGSQAADLRLTEIALYGRVECSGQGYRFSSNEALIVFDGNRPTRVLAKGRAALQGSAGSGVGDALEILFEPGKAMPRIQWVGGVRGKHEVPLGR
jgi:hypothetical protein